MSKSRMWGIVGALVLIFLILVWFISRPEGAPATDSHVPTATSTTNTPSSNTNTGTSSNTSNTPIQTSTQPSAQPLSAALVAGDKVTSWSFTGAYAGNAQLTEKANVDIQKLNVLLNTGTYTNYDIYIGIANQYDLLGNGAEEYVYLKKALAIDSTHSGLAWDNLGQLFSKVGANLSAREAYKNAIKVQPTPQYAQDYYQFLLSKFPNDTAGMLEAQRILVPARDASQ